MHRHAPPLGGCAGKFSTFPPSNLTMCFMLMCARALMWAKSVEFDSWASMLAKRFHAARLLGSWARGLPVESRSALASMMRPHHLPSNAAILVAISRICSKSGRNRNIFGKQPSALFISDDY